jgi:hypothetical protein
MKHTFIDISAHLQAASANSAEQAHKARQADVCCAIKENKIMVNFSPR